MTHWTWYIFPQLKFLGHSYNAIYYGIENIEEAKAFYSDCFLGKNLKEISTVLLECESDNALEIMGYPDNMKLCSSMTLFLSQQKMNCLKKLLINFLMEHLTM